MLNMYADLRIRLVNFAFFNVVYVHTTCYNLMCVLLRTHMRDAASLFFLDFQCCICVFNMLYKHVFFAANAEVRCWKGR
jgi:hypothetical protein